MPYCLVIFYSFIPMIKESAMKSKVNDIAFVTCMFGNSPSRVRANTTALEMILKQTPSPNIFVIVELVNGNSSSLYPILHQYDSVKHLVLHGCDAHLDIFQKEALFNIGARSCNEKHLVFCDADSYPISNGWFYAISSNLNSDGRSTMFQCYRLLRDSKNPDDDCLSLAQSHSVSNTFKRLPCPGIAWAMTRDVFNEIGGFNPYGIGASGDLLFIEECIENHQYHIDNNLDYISKQLRRLPQKFNLAYIDAEMKHVNHGYFDRSSYYHLITSLSAFGDMRRYIDIDPTGLLFWKNPCCRVRRIIYDLGRDSREKVSRSHPINNRMKGTGQNPESDSAIPRVRRGVPNAAKDNYFRSMFNESRRESPCKTVNPNGRPRMQNSNLAYIVVSFGQSSQRLENVRTTIRTLAKQSGHFEIVFVELLFGNEQSAFSDIERYATHIILRGTNKHKDLFQKECLFNIAALHCKDFDFLVFADADVLPLEKNQTDWIQKIENHLERYPDKALQPFRRVIDPRDSRISNFSYAYFYRSNKPLYQYVTEPPNPGICWAMTYQLFDEMKGFNPKSIPGSGDVLFVRERLAAVTPEFEYLQYTWFKKIIRTNVRKVDFSYLDIDLLHLYHGPKSDRAYVNSRRIIDIFGDMEKFVKIDEQGLLAWKDEDCLLRKMLARKKDIFTEDGMKNVFKEEKRNQLLKRRIYL